MVTPRRQQNNQKVGGANNIFGGSICAKQDNVCSCTQDVPLMPKGEWLLDTGCGHDLISQKMVGNGPVRRLDNDEIISFATANGRITTEIVAPMFCEELKDLVEPLVLPDTPAVLSIGRRCMRMGYGFYWHPGQNPSLVTPEGNVVSVLVKKDIPYMAVGSSRSLPKSPKAFIEVPVVPAVEQDESAKNTTDQQMSENKTASLHNNSDVSEAGKPSGTKSLRLHWPLVRGV
jgi:hypothetical protein